MPSFIALISRETCRTGRTCVSLREGGSGRERRNHKRGEREGMKEERVGGVKDKIWRLSGNVQGREGGQHSRWL